MRASVLSSSSASAVTAVRSGGPAESAAASSALVPVTPGPLVGPPPTSARTDLRANVGKLAERHSLTEEAARRRRKFQIRDEDLDQLAFPETEILEREDARTLLLCLPLVPRSHEEVDASGQAVVVEDPPELPACHLLFSTAREHPATVGRFEELYLQSGRQLPTVFVARSGRYVFGGYSADPWFFNGEYMGSTSSFLFSLSQNCKIPFVGRVRGPPQRSDAENAANHRQDFDAKYADWQMFIDETRHRLAADGVVFGDDGQVVDNPHGVDTSDLNYPPPRFRPWTRYDAIRADGDAGTLQFGLKDLSLSESFTECSSELEQSYGIGLRPGSEEARTFLAGQERFALDALEVYLVVDAGEVDPLHAGGDDDHVDGGAGVGGDPGDYPPPPDGAYGSADIPPPPGDGGGVRTGGW